MSDCKCDKVKMQNALDSYSRREAPWALDKDGNKLFYVDSFGFRGRLPGECDSCFKEYVRKYNDSCCID